MNDSTGVRLPINEAIRILQAHQRRCKESGLQIRRCDCGGSELLVCYNCNTALVYSHRGDGPCACLDEHIAS